MPTTVLQVPTLNDSTWDFERLFALWSQANGYFETVRFDFSQCTFLRPNAVVFLGGLARLIESRYGTVTFDWGSFTDQAVLTNLQRNGLAGIFGRPSRSWSGNSIPYREDTIEDPDGILDYLSDYWLGRGWVRVSQRLKDAIVGKMWEIYANAFEHADSPVGIFSCGQHFPRVNELVLSVVDFGVGIAANVRNFLRGDSRAERLTAGQCLLWAFGPGNSTRVNGMARGLGLDLLREFIQVNHGKLEVYTNEGYGLIDTNGGRFVDRQTSFEGTVFHITLQCDERYYQFADENSTDMPF